MANLEAIRLEREESVKFAVPHLPGDFKTRLRFWLKNEADWYGAGTDPDFFSTLYDPDRGKVYEGQVNADDAFSYGTVDTWKVCVELRQTSMDPDRSSVRLWWAVREDSEGWQSKGGPDNERTRAARQHIQAVKGKFSSAGTIRPSWWTYKHGKTDEFWKDLQEWYDGEQEEITSISELARDLDYSREHVSTKINDAREQANSNGF